MTQYWLFKTEPDAFSIDDLAACPNKREGWDGIRNYQARNFMRDKMQVGDKAFIYHSSCKDVGIVGLAKVSQTGLVDPLQFDPESKYFDPKSSPENPLAATLLILRVRSRRPLIVNGNAILDVAEANFFSKSVD
jgi:predicted RNA-binding protein with PUA-like domain